MSQAENQHKFIDALTLNMYKNTENVSEFCYILFELMRNDALCDYAVQKRIPGILMDNITRKVIERMKDPKELEQLAASNEENVEEEIGKEIIIEKTAYELAKKPRPSNEVPHVWGILGLAIKRAKALEVPLEKYLVQT